MTGNRNATEQDAPAPIGVIGLGNMGAQIARRLLQWPGGLVVHDLRPESMQRLVSKGAVGVKSVGAVGESARIISVIVLDDAQVEDVLAGPGGLFETCSPGSVIAIHSTITVDTAISLAGRGAELGLHVVDAPVSGGAPAAKAGRLAVMVGASDEAFDICSGPFALFGEMVVRAGGIGAGTRMKLARNLLHFVAFTAACEANSLAEASGIDLEALGRVVRHSDSITGGAGAIMLRDTTAPLDEDADWYPILAHVRNLGEKDLSLALALGHDLGVHLPMAEIALNGLARGLGVPPGPIASATIEKGIDHVR